MNQKTHSAKNIITAIDLGSSHCLTLIATRDLNSSELIIVGMGNVPSKGIRRSTIINLEEAIETIENSVAMAEKICGLNISSAYLNISGQHVSSINSKGAVVVRDSNNVTESDIDRAIEAARAFNLPADREVLNLTPRFYTVDDQEGIKDPTSMVGIKLETDIHLITCSSSALLNLEKALRDIDLVKDNFVFSGYAASEVVLDEAEKDAGVICIDIGSDTTNFCAYVDGAITYSGVVPVGARYITQDINAYVKIGIDNAEKIKIALSGEDNEVTPQRPDESREDYRRRLKQADILNLQAYDPHIKPSTISKNTLIRSVIMPREKEIFSLIYEELRKQKLIGKLGAGAVIVGGGAKTVGLMEIVSRTLGMQARIGIPKGIQGVIRHIDDPIYATAIGLLHYGLKEQLPQSTQTDKNSSKQPVFDNFFSKISKSFKKFMP